MQACSRARCRTFGPARDLDERRPFGSARQATQKQGRWRRYRSALPCIVCHRSSPHGRDGETVVRREGEKGRAVTVGHYACPRCLGCRFLPTRRLTFLPDPTSCRTGVIWPRARPRRDSTWAVWMCRRKRQRGELLQAGEGVAPVRSVDDARHAPHAPHGGSGPRAARAVFGLPLQSSVLAVRATPTQRVTNSPHTPILLQVWWQDKEAHGHGHGHAALGWEGECRSR